MKKAVSLLLSRLSDGWREVGWWWKEYNQLVAVLTVVGLFLGGGLYIPVAIRNNTHAVGESMGAPVQKDWGMIEMFYAEEYPKAFQQACARTLIRVWVRGKIVKIDRFPKTRECREPRYEVQMIADGIPRTEIFFIRFNFTYEFRELPTKE